MPVPSPLSRDTFLPLALWAGLSPSVRRPFTWDPPKLEGQRISLLYWTDLAGKDIEPEAAKPRINRFKAYDQLYSGDWQPLNMQTWESSVRVNSFARVTDSYVNLIMAKAPMFEPELPDEFDRAMLTSAIAAIIADLTRYGTAILYPSENMVERLDPRCWYPAVGDEQAAYVWKEPAPSVDGKKTDAMFVNVTVFDQETETGQLAYSQRGDRFTSVYEMDEMVRYEEMFIPQVISVPPLVDDYWGTSIYEGMVHIVAEQTRRASGAGDILRNHERPRLKLKLKAGAEQSSFGPPEERQKRLLVDQVQLDEQYQNDILSPLAPYEDVELMVYNAQMEGNFKQRELMQEMESSVTGLPLSFLGVLSRGVLPSGNALRAQLAMAHARIEMYHSLITPALVNALKIATGMDFVVTWDNPIDDLSTVQVAQVPMDEDDEEDEAAEDAIQDTSPMEGDATEEEG